MSKPFPRFAIDRRLPLRVMERIEVREWFRIGSWQVCVEFVIPEGFWHDGNSVPGFMQSVISPQQLAGQGVKHDYLYRYGKPLPKVVDLYNDIFKCKPKRPRYIADCLYRHCLDKYNSVTAPKWKRAAAYWGVRLFGWSSYKSKNMAIWAEKMENQYQRYLETK